MKRKTPRQKIIQKLDKAVSIFIRERDGACVQCGSVENLTNGHIFSRRNYSTRWDVTADGNCHTQCWSCNYYHGQDDKWKYYNWYIGRFGQEKFDELYIRHKTTAKFKTFELEEMLEELKAKS